MLWTGMIGIGLMAGVLSGLFGIGGGIVLVPALVFFFKFQLHAASGTSLAAMLLPVGALGVWQYYHSGKIGPENLRAGGWIAVGMFIGAFLGSKIAVSIDVRWMQRLFAALLVFAAFRLLSHSMR
ncbi:MAG: sulfite exporter TauE/SafE family protein [Bdellovibrionales bacterium]|nr:sulfite exporter TauE/SafE family protein [Bdellovibrionales bacterium]